MANIPEQRGYQRCTSIICKVHVSSDRRQWSDVGLCDVSAGGLKFTSSKSFEKDVQLYFDLSVYNMLSEFNMKFDGKIIRESNDDGMHTYSIEFDKPDKYTQIQLDELIKSKVTLKDSLQPNSDDGIYTFLFLPKGRSKRICSYK